MLARHPAYLGKLTIQVHPPHLTSAILVQGPVSSFERDAPARSPTWWFFSRMLLCHALCALLGSWGTALAVWPQPASPLAQGFRACSQSCLAHPCFLGCLTESHQLS